MNKLTAEKCRDRIARLKECEKLPWGLSIDGIYQLQALEIALPILEQQERGCQKCGGTGMADSGGTQPWGERIPIECDCKFEQQEIEGWIEWTGGECPLKPMAMVECKLRSGIVQPAEASCYWRWRHNQGMNDIIAYRIILEQPTNQNGEQ